MKSLLMLLLAPFVMLPLASAQTRVQVFAGAGGSFPQVGDPLPTAVFGGAAIIPVVHRMFVRPALAVGRNFPAAGKPVYQAQVLMFVGYRAAPYLALLVGRGETIIMSKASPGSVLPTTVVSSAWSPWCRKQGWQKGVGLFTPVSYTARKGWNAGFQFGYTWR